ncbi:MAG: acylneuraminate cytidylyltransferase family protein [Thermodesulfobacteriota bacterium]
MKIISIIPARGGSKCIPRKNIYRIFGKPLIGYTIEHAFASDRIERVIVSTDDEEIGVVARVFGAEVPFLRPSEISGDETPDFPVFKHALNWLKDNECYKPDIIVHLRPTSPFRITKDIDKMVEVLMANPEADSIRSVSVSKQTPYKMWNLNGKYIEPFIDHNFNEQTLTAKQFLPQVLYHNGNIDVIRVSSIMKGESLTGKNILPFMMHNEICDIQIDSMFDLRMAEMAIRLES